METIQMNDMDRLLPPLEQAKIIGLVKEPERLQQDEKQNYILYGMAITCLLFVSFSLIQHVIEKNNRKEKQKVL